MNGQIFRVATLQMQSIVGQAEKNTNIIIEQMKKSAEMQSDILLLPECFISGYSFPIADNQIINISGEYVSRICAAARRYKIGVVATAFTRGITKPQNSALVIDKSGKLLMQYSKVHTCDFADEACLEGGKEFEVCDFDGVKIGIMICYDREYPESARILMLKGAEIILVPNDCNIMQPRVGALSTRAYENMVGVVMANPPKKNGGMSCAFSPICWDSDENYVDNKIFVAGETCEGIHLADFDMSALRAYRGSEMMGNTFRKVQAYSELLSQNINEPFIR